MQESELNECRNDIHERDQQLLAMSQNFNQATVAIQETRDTCEHLKAEKQKCELQLQQFAATIAQVEAQKETIVEHLESHKQKAIKYEVFKLKILFVTDLKMPCPRRRSRTMKILYQALNALQNKKTLI